ncbi:crossover junction endodeoxyribonuclease RuvC [Peptoniphilus raoultii]|uniref:crossover junction endodeoxyribonuclease RuvC n=1 Tax=Peptoniphilus raoultii TaxID=1776387 RepID=UPI0008DAC642|nr:crossover junction endodeoxyribonuclease RuvC [Peptoniphilus raoultii]
MRILGIDPGLAIIGYGIIDFVGNSFKVIDYGQINTPAKMPIADRIQSIYRDLNRILETYKPEDIAFEELFYNKNAKTVINVAQARGVEVLACRNFTNSIYEYTPLQIKKSLVGYGRATKEQIQYMVRVLLHLEEVPKPDDVADALAVALTHASSINFKESFRMI